MNVNNVEKLQAILQRDLIDIGRNAGGTMNAAEFASDFSFTIGRLLEEMECVDVDIEGFFAIHDYFDRKFVAGDPAPESEEAKINHIYQRSVHKLSEHA